MLKLDNCIHVLMAAALGLTTAVTVVGCDDGPPGQSITIESPANNALIARGLDVDPATDGIQIAPTASVVGLTAGDTIEMRVDGTAMSTGIIQASGQVDFGNVTVSTGEHVLVAATLDGSLESMPHTITVTDTCFNTTFVTPSPPVGGSLVLGPTDDEDGEMCGMSFETTFVISTDAGNGAMATLYINNTPRGSVVVSGTTATFPNIVLDSRAPDMDTVEVEVTSADGATSCRDPYPAPVVVDCEGASCSLTLPDSGSTFLNQDDDLMPGAPFTTNFQAQVGPTGVGQPIRLVVDGNESGATSADTASDGTADFPNVQLDEGVHQVFAICEDDAGNFTRSGVAEWTVDITPCAIAVTSPTADELFIDADDVNAGVMGIQILASGTSAGPDCSGVRVGQCASIDSVMFGTWSADWAEETSLSSDPTQQLCAQVVDNAGNIAEAMVGVRVQTDAPQLTITTPTAGTSYNAAGTAGRTADLNPGSVTCEAAFSVDCSGVGSPVELVRTDTMAVLVGGTANCDASGSALGGTATFASVSLPSLGGGTAISVAARQTVDRLTGTSSTLSILSDCDVPSLTIQDPMCGSTIRPSTQDVDPGTAGFQYNVTVLNSNVPKPAVDVVLRDSGGAAVAMSSGTGPAGITSVVSGLTWPGGAISVEACATDMAGNTGCEPRSCTVTVADLPTLAITAPAGMALLDATADCAPGTAGMQIQVTATTDASAGSTTSIQVVGGGTATPAISGGMFGACVDAPQGSVTINVSVTDPVRGTSMATRMVTVDSLPPATAISDFTPGATMDRRAGDVQFSWTDVADAGGGTLTDYELRCSTTGPITNATEWAAATVVMFGETPMAGGTARTATVPGHRLEQERWCVLRAADAPGSLTPLPSTPPASVTIPAMQNVLTAPAAGFGTVVTGIGDVNGDGIDDILAGSGRSATEGDAAYVFYGGAAGPDATPDLTILGPGGAAGAYALVVSTAGDLNNDGRPDFAVSARGFNGQRGVVYVFFGRSSATAWPTGTVIDLSGGCLADVCFNGTDMGALLGFSMASAGDFDGDGIDDLALGAWRFNLGNTGRVYVIRGGTFASGASFDVPGTAGTQPQGWMVDAPASGSYAYGRTVASCGDLSGDGRAELIVGAPGNGTTLVPGKVYRVNGRAFGGSGLVTIPGTESTELSSGGAAIYALALSCVGDFNGDGARDMAVYNSGTGTGGAVQVMLQTAGTYSAANVVTISNNGADSTNDFLGFSIAVGWTRELGDRGRIDVDTFSDVFVGSREDGTGPGSGELMYGVGGATLLQRSRAATFNPTSTEASGERSAGYVGDVNGDGFNDLAIGDNNTGGGAGQVVVYY